MAVPSVDRQTFLARLRRSGLVRADRLAAVLAELPATARGRFVARALVARGLLTRFQAGQLLAGRSAGFFLGPYRILDQIGQGGMGRVYKAEHRALRRVVALKVLAPDAFKSRRARALFRREIRAVARVVHPNLVTALDAGRAGGRSYLVLEYVNGPNLDRLVRTRGPLPVGLACDLVRQVADGLQHAHEQGLVHRDIKPSNVLLASGGPAAGWVPKLGDFGLARLGGDDASPGGTIVARKNAVLGTPDYMAPEQARDVHQSDIRSDLYSLGCTFYFLLTGRVPFPGGTALEKVIRHSVEPPAPVERLRPDVPPAVAAVVRRLMAKDPAGRFQTPAELAAALAPFAVQGPAGEPAPMPGAPAVDPLATPAGEPVTAGGEDRLADPPATGEEAQALVTTLPVDSVVVVGHNPSDRTGERRRVVLALLWALVLVGTLLGSGLALSLLLAR